jgi:uncharacterized coiled-coil protein SlyX
METLQATLNLLNEKLQNLEASLDAKAQVEIQPVRWMRPTVTFHRC